MKAKEIGYFVALYDVAKVINASLEPSEVLQEIVDCVVKAMPANKGDAHSSVVDIEFTQILRDNMAKDVAWYDNEWGYSCRVADPAHYMAKKGLRG